eukprot:8227997-Pyramimonas_sp.AAC.1
MAVPPARPAAAAAGPPACRATPCVSASIAHCVNIAQARVRPRAAPLRRCSRAIPRARDGLGMAATDDAM